MRSSILLTIERNTVSGVGLEVTPNIPATSDQGIHETTLTVNAGATVDPGAARPQSNSEQSPNGIASAVRFGHAGALRG